MRYEYICLNVYHQQLTVKQYEHEGGEPWLDFLKNQRSNYPLDERVYLKQDGLPAHWAPDIRRWARKSDVTLVPTAKNASWMNPVECHTGDIQKLALSGTDYRSRDEVEKSFENAVKYRNMERKERSKRFRDTQRDGRRKHRRPLWTRH